MNNNEASSLIGKTVIVGMNYFDDNEGLVKQEQYSGTVEKVEGSWIQITTGGEIKRIPSGNILYAPSGEYESLSNSMKIKNPEFISSWCVKPSKDPQSPLLWKPNYAPLISSSVPREWRLTYDFDEAKNRELIKTKRKDYLGKHVLVGISRYQKVEGRSVFVEQRQIHGHISKISFRRIVLSLNNGTEYSLPPDLTLLQPAGPGTYTLRSTGEKINNVDFVTTWDSFAPKK